MPKDDEDKAHKLPFELTAEVRKSFLDILSRLITVKVDYNIEKPEKGTLIVKIDLPFIKGYLVVGVYMLGKEIFVGYVEIV